MGEDNKKSLGFASRIKWGEIITPLIGIALGLLVGAIFIWTQGVNPLHAYYYLLEGSILSWASLSGTLVKTVPLALTGLAVLFSYKSEIFNVGAEGQVYLGAIGATMIGINFPNIPAPLHIFMAIVFAGILGGAFAFIPGYLKAYKGVNEIVVTMLLNYIALYFLSMMVQGPLKEPDSFFPRSLPMVDTAVLPKLFGSHLHIGILFAIVLAIFLSWFFRRTTTGFKMVAAGYNPNALHYAGVNVKSLLTKVMVASGFIAGAAGAVEIMGVHGRLIENFSIGLGYDAIAVALLANLSPLGVLLSAFFFGALKTGANSMQISTGIPVSFVYMVQAMVILFVVASKEMPRIIAIINKRRRVKKNG
jgi:simple sugar transport system permease protein